MIHFPSSKLEISTSGRLLSFFFAHILYAPFLLTLIISGRILHSRMASRHLGSSSWHYGGPDRSNKELTLGGYRTPSF